MTSAMDETVTDWYRFAGANIKGTPAMPARDVAHDLEVLQDECSVLVLQEFRWPWYWRTLKRALGSEGWRSAPGMLRGLRAPVFGAQAVLWRGKRWRKIDVQTCLLHKGVALVSEDRYLRRVLLQDRETGVPAWHWTTHAVVKGDRRDSPVLRRRIMQQDLDVLERELHAMRLSGHASIGQADLNIHPGTWAYVALMKILQDVDARLVGQHGVEYLIVMNGRDVKVETRRGWEIPTSRLRTDHEVRGMTCRLVRS